MAWLVAHLRKRRYRKFQRKNKAGDKAEDQTVGINGRISIYVQTCICQCVTEQLSTFVLILFYIVLVSAYEWQSYEKPLHPVSVEIDGEKKLQVFDRSGPALRSLVLGSQPGLDVRLSTDRQCRALLLKLAKEYDLVRKGRTDIDRLL